MADLCLCPLTVAEARAILVADDALALSFPQREACGQLLGLEEGDAWRRLVESAVARITAWEGSPPDRSGSSSPYPGGNEPDFQTLFAEAVALSEQRRKA